MGIFKSFISGFLIAICSAILCDSLAKTTTQSNLNRIEVPFSNESGFSTNPIEFYKNPIDENKTEFSLKVNGKVSVIILTTTWCHNCPDIVKNLSACADNLQKNKDIIFHNIIIGNDSFDNIKKHFDKINVKNFKLYNSLPMSVIVGLDSIPTCVVFDKYGKQVFRYSGKVDYNSKKFRKFLEDLSKR